ncbi:MAG: hypothetical protein N2312_02265 [Dictyoglomaceae bacterium]|nr:hypothetical protein [Dictyoglomaceae bacterium]
MKITDVFRQIKWKESQEINGFSIIPLFLSISHIPPFISLEEALNSGKFIIQEVNTWGEVPTLKAVNRLNINVFIMDGEELKGGKQNRVINTSILVKKNSVLNIPVSCTEKGRWDFTSPHHRDPEIIIPFEMRAKKNISLYDHLSRSKEFKTEQSLIWDEVDRYDSILKSNSKTRALRDIFKNVETNLEEITKNSFPIEGQNGCAFVINGKIIGLDIISLPSVYKNFHGKLLKSYAFDLLIRKKTETKNLEEDIESYIEKIKNASFKKYKSVGLGWDYRIKRDKLMGSILMYRHLPVHIHIFQI